MKSRVKRWGIVCGGLFIIVVIATLLLRHWMSGSSTGTVHVGTPKVTANAPAAATQPVSVTTSYFSTLLPAGFSIKRQTETPSAELIQLELVADTSSTANQQCAITVGTIPAAGLQQVGDYNLRTTATSTYQPFTMAGLPAGTTAFQTISGPAAYTLFWPHGTHYIAIAVSTDGGTPASQLQTTLSQVISSWAWK